MREKIGDLAEWLCTLTHERFWRILHPVFEWGYKNSQ